jgi:hypothetical protein
MSHSTLKTNGNTNLFLIGPERSSLTKKYASPKVHDKIKTEFSFASKYTLISYPDIFPINLGGGL